MLEEDIPMSAIASRWVTHGAIRYHYRVAGAEDARTTPLVLVHGLGVSSAYWRRVQPLLAARRRVYALDLPGFGRTTRPRTLLDTVALSLALDDWLAALHLSPVHLLGHSMGGPVVVAFARAHAARVRGLILVGSTIGVRGAHAPRLALGLLRDAVRESPSLLPVVLADYRRAGLRRVLGTEALVDADDTIATAAGLAMPVLVVRGSRDRVVPPGDTQLLRRSLPAASYVEIANGAHAVQWGWARTLARAVDVFLMKREMEARTVGLAP